MVLFPALMLLVFGLVQGALWHHARNVASAAAQEGAREARAEAGTAEAGRARAAAFTAAAGGADVLADERIVATADGQQVRVVVTGRSISLLPGLAGPRVEQSATGPVERFTAAGTP